MTREEWNTCTDPKKMFEQLTWTTDPMPGKVLTTERKLELWCCACCWSHGITPREGPEWQKVLLTSEWATHWAGQEYGAWWAIYEAESKAPDIRCDLLRQMLGDVFAPVKIEKKYITPQVLQLAQQAYENVNNGQMDQLTLMALSDALIEAGLEETIYECGDKDCPQCEGAGELYGNYFAEDGMEPCDRCGGKGTVWGDEEYPNPILSSLRDPRPRYRGLWSLDLILGFE